MKRIVWFVNSGVNTSHLINTEKFDKLSEAREFVASLPSTPSGLKRPYEIIRAEYKRCEWYGDDVEFKKIA